MDSVPLPVASWGSDLTCNGQASPCWESFSTTGQYGSFLSKETPKHKMYTCWMVGIVRGQMNSTNATPWSFPPQQHPRAAPHTLGSLQQQHVATLASIHSCCKMHFAAFLTAVFMPRHCSVHGAAEYEKSHGGGASCPSLPACSSGVPSLPLYLSQQFSGLCGHSSNKKE